MTPEVALTEADLFAEETSACEFATIELIVIDLFEALSDAFKEELLAIVDAIFAVCASPEVTTGNFDDATKLALAF